MNNRNGKSFTLTRGGGVGGGNAAAGGGVGVGGAAGGSGGGSDSDKSNCIQIDAAFVSAAAARLPFFIVPEHLCIQVCRV